MVSVTELEFNGYKGQSVLGTFYRQDSPTDHLAMIFPGYGYTCDMPLLYLPKKMLVENGADVLQVNYAFSNKPGFWQSGDETRAIWFGSDATVAMRTVLEKADYKQFTLIGKSLGTLAVGHLVTLMSELADARIILFTPLLKNPRLVQQLAAFKGKTMLVVGADDPFHAADNLKIIQKMRTVDVIEIPGTDHSLEIKGDVSHSLDVLGEVMQGVARFLQPNEAVLPVL